MSDPIGDRETRHGRAEQVADAVEGIIAEAARDVGARTNRDLLAAVAPELLSSYDRSSDTVAATHLATPGTLYPAARVPEFVMDLSRRWFVRLCAGEGLCRHLVEQGHGRNRMLPCMLAAWEKPLTLRCLNCPDRPQLDPVEERRCDVCGTVVDEITPVRGAFGAMFVVFGACEGCAKTTVRGEK